MLDLICIIWPVLRSSYYCEGENLVLDDLSFNFPPLFLTSYKLTSYKLPPPPLPNKLKSQQAIS
jgi:hypothetical protein